jgi:hypothetical protein
MRNKLIATAIATTVLLLGAVAPANAALYLSADLAQQGYHIFGSTNTVAVCKTSSCNQSGDFAFTCSWLTGSTFGADVNDVANCATACPACELTRSGLASWPCCGGSATKGTQSRPVQTTP